MPYDTTLMHFKTCPTYLQRTLLACCLAGPLSLCATSPCTPWLVSHPVPRASAARVIPAKGVLLFQRLQQIKFGVMANPDTLQGVSLPYILCVKKSLQRVFVKQGCLPACVIEASGIKRKWTKAQHTLYCLYDILQCIFGHGKECKGFATYSEAYQAGILPFHLCVLDTAIGTAENIRRCYLGNLAFATTFGLLTNDLYDDRMRPAPVYGHAKGDDKTLVALHRRWAAIHWLEVHTSGRLPQGITHGILRYAFGLDLDVYDRLCSVDEVVFQCDAKQGGGGYANKGVALGDIATVQRMLQGIDLEAKFLPQAFVTTHRVIRVEPYASAHDASTFVYVRYHTLYDVWGYVKKTPHPVLVREGWTQTHGLHVEAALQKHMPELLDGLGRSVGELTLTGLCCLLGVYGVSKAAQCTSKVYSYAL